MILPSELILNTDGSVYHLKLRPEQIAPTVITVGDPGRVEQVSKYFDKIYHKESHREFVSHTGELNGQMLTVLSTGIGTDNIDIVMNELDALVNIDLKTREVKNQLRSLDIIRIGTCGSLQANIPCDTFVLSSHGLGLDGLMPFYQTAMDTFELDILQALNDKIQLDKWLPIPAYLFSGSSNLLNHFANNAIFEQGITATCTGFYAPQGRILRIAATVPDILAKLAEFEGENGLRISNFEMETAGIYGLAKAMGHEALSCSVVMANRVEGKFSEQPGEMIEKLIETVLEMILKKS
ncbi:MAG: nucleoside phosphorylase [Saprospiraceae bacterium]